MKKVILLFCVFVLNGELFSQQDPQWVAPFYFEDANGDKDTIYIGYDSLAGPSILDIDEQFDEGWQWIDTSKFNVYILQYPHFNPGPDHIISDYVRKKNVTAGTMYADIGFVHGKMPITMKWLDSLFYSDNLPFPDLFPRPNARADIYWEQSEPGYGDCNMDEAPFVLTDYFNEGFQCFAMDSLYLDGSGNWLPRLAILYMSLHIVPYNYGLSTIQNNSKISIEIYPNPFNNELHIEFGKLFNGTINIYSIDGKIIYKSEISNNQNNLSINPNFMNKGVYLIHLEDDKTNVFQKIIK
ncbi:MAG: T9SS type A sorting domain-containing protein [Chlorobi bacterium]|nr:T9SS type A sorting domain-containing protein [Chlorobiota bacterium]